MGPWSLVLAGYNMSRQTMTREHRRPARLGKGDRIEGWACAEEPGLGAKVLSPPVCRCVRRREPDA